MRLEVLCGPFACGKSTYAVHRAKQGAFIINDDSIVNAVHGGINTLYEEELKSVYKGLEHHIFESAVSMGRDIVIDRPNVEQSTRERWIRLADAFEVDERVLVIFKWDGQEEHVARRMKDSRGYTADHWRMAYQRMNKSLNGGSLSSISDGFTSVRLFDNGELVEVK
jgi:predicted kinase